jgi:hypothetical protein
VLSAVTASLLVCFVKLFIWYVAVCCLCVCVPDVPVCGMFGTAKHPTDRYIRHTHTHIDNIQPEDGQTIVTETCRFINYVFL